MVKTRSLIAALLLIGMVALAMFAGGNGDSPSSPVGYSTATMAPLPVE